MSKYLKLAGVVAMVAVIALASVVAVSAQTATPPQGAGPWNNTGGYAGRGRGPGGQGLGIMAVDEAVMHAKIAEALGISVEEFEAARAEGKTPYILAQELGIDFAEVRAAMDAAHAEALAQAVADGTITQEQADWILSHRAQMGRWDASGAGPMGRGARTPLPARGAGVGGFGGYAGECPYTTP